MYVDNNYLTPDFFNMVFRILQRKKKKIRRVPEETILLVIDECQLLFNARAWNDKNRAAWISFF